MPVLLGISNFPRVCEGILKIRTDVRAFFGEGLQCPSMIASPIGEEVRLLGLIVYREKDSS